MQIIATDPANYGPISTLSSLSKVFEKLFYNQLYKFLENMAFCMNLDLGRDTPLSRLC